VKKLPHIEIHQITTAQTAVARMKVGVDPFKDPKVRKAMKLAIDPATILKIAYRDLGAPADHHHCCPVHPDYAEVPKMGSRCGGGEENCWPRPGIRTGSRSN